MKGVITLCIFLSCSSVVLSRNSRNQEQSCTFYDNHDVYPAITSLLFEKLGNIERVIIDSKLNAEYIIFQDTTRHIEIMNCKKNQIIAAERRTNRVCLSKMKTELESEYSDLIGGIIGERKELIRKIRKQSSRRLAAVINLMEIYTQNWLTCQSFEKGSNECFEDASYGKGTALDTSMNHWESDDTDLISKNKQQLKEKLDHFRQFARKALQRFEMCVSSEVEQPTSARQSSKNIFDLILSHNDEGDE